MLGMLHEVGVKFVPRVLGDITIGRRPGINGEEPRDGRTGQLHQEALDIVEDGIVFGKAQRPAFGLRFEGARHADAGNIQADIRPAIAADGGLVVLIAEGADLIGDDDGLGGERKGRIRNRQEGSALSGLGDGDANRA